MNEKHDWRHNDSPEEVEQQLHAAFSSEEKPQELTDSKYASAPDFPLEKCRPTEQVQPLIHAIDTHQSEDFMALDEDSTSITTKASRDVPTKVVVVPPPEEEDSDEISDIQDRDLVVLSLDTSHPAKWAITFQQLLAVETIAKKMFGFRYRWKTMRDITKAIVIPVCQHSGTSYALNLNPNGYKLGAFITHCWDECFGSFVDSIRRAFHHFPVKPHLWICAFALVQGNSRETVSEQLQTPLEYSPFVLALQQATWFVVVRNSNKDLYSRIWCVCELMFALKFGFTTANNKNNGLGIDDDDDEETNSSRKATMVIGPDAFSTIRTSCLDAEASDDKDKEKILQMLQSEHTVEEVDDLVQQYREYDCQPRNRRKTNPNGHGLTTLLGLLSLCLLVACTSIIAWQSKALISLDDPIRPIPLQHGQQTKEDGRGIPLPPAAKPVQFFDPINFINKLPNFTLDALKDSLSPQSMAMNWSLSNPHYLSKAHWQQAQLFALVTFFYSFSGDYWYDREKHNWLRYDIPECEWDSSAISCNNHGRVTRIHLDSKGVFGRGRTPPEVSLLRSLEKMEFSRMDLYTPLTQLLPPQLSLLQNLTDLLLPYNSISGTLPSYVGSFQDLTNLNLKSNDIHAPLPSQLGLVSNLHGLVLANNALSGNIPPQLSHLTALRTLHIQDNNLRGRIPENLCFLTFLADMRVDCQKVVCSQECNCSCLSYWGD